MTPVIPLRAVVPGIMFKNNSPPSPARERAGDFSTSDKIIVVEIGHSKRQRTERPLYRLLLLDGLRIDVAGVVEVEVVGVAGVRVRSR